MGIKSRKKKTQEDIKDATPIELKTVKNQMIVETARSRQLGRAVSVSQCFVVFTQFWGSNKQIVGLQSVNRLFYKRVGQWVRFVTLYPTIRRTKVVCHEPLSTEELVFPTRPMIEDVLSKGGLLTLTGIERNYGDGLGWLFNFILSNLFSLL